MPSREQVLEHLAQILQSDIFHGAARQQRLLRHLVERQIEGRTSELKEYTLGVEVFDRGENFDPRLDPIVRVEVGRLRGRLRKYYDSAPSSIFIELPKGAYLPVFTEPPAVAPPPAPAPPLPVAAPPRPARGWRFFPLALAAAIILGAAVWPYSRVSTRSSPEFARYLRLASPFGRAMTPSFDPSGRSLVYAARDKGNWDIYQQQIGSLTATNLTDSPQDDVQPAFSPDGRRLAFRSSRDGGGIFLLELASRRVQKVTTGGYHPAWSPDGKKIAFSTETFNDPSENPPVRSSSLRVIDLATSTVTPIALPDSANDALQPAWSPDGRQIAFWGADLKGNRDVWIMTLGVPGTARRVASDLATDWGPTWSADGEYIYFSSDRGGAMNIWRIASRAGAATPEPVTTPASYSGWAAFSADGQRFAYVRRLISSRLNRVAFDIERGVNRASIVQLTDGERRVREPDLSPDGRRLAVRLQDPQEDIAIAGTDGRTLRRLTNDAFRDRSPRWTPDGKQIVFLSDRNGTFDLWIVGADGGAPQPLTRGGAIPATWAPDGNLVGYPQQGNPFVLLSSGHPLALPRIPEDFVPLSWSPGGRYVAGRRSRPTARGTLVIYTPESRQQWEVAAVAPATIVWLSNQEQFLFSRSDGIYMADARTHEVRPVLVGIESELHGRFTLSRNDRDLYFSSVSDAEDIWVGSH